MELVFNDLSLNNKADKSAAIKAIGDFLIILSRLSEFLGIVPELRCRKDLIVVPICENYFFYDWLNDGSIDQDDKTYLLSFLTKIPFIEDLSMDVSNYEFHCCGEESNSLLYAVLSDNATISFAINERWRRDVILAELKFFDEVLNIVCKRVEIRNLFSVRSITRYNDFLLRRGYPDFSSGPDFENNLANNFPSLTIIPNVRNTIRSLNPRDPKTKQIIKALTILNRYCLKTKESKSYIDLRNEGIFIRSESTVTMQKYGEERTFSYNEQRIQFEWHFDINPGAWRCYIYTQDNFSSLLISIIHCNNASCLLENLRSKIVVFLSVVWLINVKRNAKNSWKN